MECNAVNQCYDNTPLKRPNTPPLLGVAPNTLTQPANTPRCQLNTLVCCHNTPCAVTPLKPHTPRLFFLTVHIIKVKEHCRVCGHLLVEAREKKARSSYMCQEFEAHVFDINTSNDIINTHPPFFCYLSKRMLTYMIHPIYRRRYRYKFRELLFCNDG